MQQLSGALPMVLDAPAKLTLSLRVTGVRADGYHLLDAEMVSVDLGDTLELSAGHGVEVVDEVVGGLGVAGLSGGPGNLVDQALAAVGRSAAVRLVKRVPVGAGLGGGSSDAAAILRWAGCADAALAARLGADVPFCVVGGRARVRGIGEELTPMPFEARRFMLLLPPLSVDTAAVYRAWDEGHRSDAGGNDLEAAALAVVPALGRWRDAFAERCGRSPRLAGSGAAWFVEAGESDTDMVDATRGRLDLDGAIGALVVVASVPAEAGSGR